jgi:hypothetical protein
MPPDRQTGDKGIELLATHALQFDIRRSHFHLARHQVRDDADKVCWVCPRCSQAAALPIACHASQRSRKKSSDSLLREPFGRPLGLPDWPGSPSTRDPKRTLDRQVAAFRRGLAYCIV